MTEIQKIVLITGAAQRIGAQIAKTFQAAGYGVVLHCRNSRSQADELAAALNVACEDSAWVVQADLQSVDATRRMVDEAIAKAGRLDVVVNNASTFYETTVDEVDEEQWNDLMGSNLKAPFFVSQAACSALREVGGSIVNIVDIHGQKPLQSYSIYSVAKAGLYALTKSLAKDLAPDIRVNGVAPGAILWPENQSPGKNKEILKQIPLQRQGSPIDIATAVLFLARDANYITGQVIAVDGGKTLI